MKSGVRKLLQCVPRRTVTTNLSLSRHCAAVSIHASRSVRCSSSSSSRTTENSTENQFYTPSADTSVSKSVNEEELTPKTIKREEEEVKGKDSGIAQELKEAVANDRSKPPPSIIDQIVAMLGIKTGTPFTYTTAKSLLDNCMLSSKKNFWFDDGKGRIGKDFRSKHTLLLIHVWMIHKRLLKMGEKGQDIQVTI